MEFIIIIIFLIIMYLILNYIFDLNMKELRKIAENKELDEITKKYPNNIEICRTYLKMLDNESVKIEEDKNSNATLYLVSSNKIFIANLKDSYTRIQTIAHECLHSVQDKKMLWFNFIFSNMYIVLFLILCVLAIFKIIKLKLLVLTIFLLCGFTFYIVRTYLEDDAMIKAKFLAKKYMENVKISSKEEIDKIIKQYDKLNNIGIKYTNIDIFKNILIKTIILCVFFIIF